ncbi:MAG: hypothetical protein P1V51_00965 [Deltaproteobacteria bacterium]|nr:hypothetical protein [Deltaproteobacteria bacterium]
MAALVSGGTQASPRLATVAGLCIGPWILYALLVPGGTFGWVGFGLDALALVLLAACRGRGVPLYRPPLVRLALGGVALSALLRFGVLPFALHGPTEEGAPTMEAYGEALESTVALLLGVSLLHHLTVGLFALLLLVALVRASRPEG